MPNPGAERPLRKVTLNLFEEDVANAELIYGYGWTGYLREFWHNHLTNQRPRTVADIMKDRSDG